MNDLSTAEIILRFVGIVIAIFTVAILVGLHPKDGRRS